ncbi:MAG: diadenosine tetraphosphate hydrolase [Tenericutes bacterium GWF2_38_8]|nr:MAG: diadenosine tetraphosphate hydrolase [Tenericutes bacterium GWF2_38_8]
MPTIFSKIIAREIPAHIVYEDELVIAFLDISQATKGHTLVVPKAEYSDIFDVPEDVLLHVMRVAQKVSKAISIAFQPEGMNILSNNGAVAGQTVFHFHLHLIPRYQREEIKISLKNNMSDLNTNDYKERARFIKAALL